MPANTCPRFRRPHRLPTLTHIGADTTPLNWQFSFLSTSPTSFYSENLRKHTMCPSFILLSSVSVTFALPLCAESCPNPCRQAITNTYCTGARNAIFGTPPPAKFKNQWYCHAGGSSPQGAYIRMTEDGAAEGGVTVYCVM